VKRGFGITRENCSELTIARKTVRPGSGEGGSNRRVSLVALALQMMVCLIQVDSTSFAGEAYTAEEQAYIDLLRLPTAPVTSQWTYNPSFFDELRWGDLAAKALQKKEQLAKTDADKQPEAHADLLREVAILSSNQDKQLEAELYARKAELLYRKLIDRKPDQARLLYKLGVALNIATMGSNTDHGSRMTFKAAIKADPDYCLPYLELMDAETGLLSWREQAGRCVKRVATKQPKIAEHYYNIHLYESSAGVWDLMDLRAPLKAASTNKVSLTTLLARTAGDQSIVALRKAVALDPENITYRASLAGVLSLRNYLEWGAQMEAGAAAGRPLAAAMQQATETTKERNAGRLREAEEQYQYLEQRSKGAYPRLYMLWSILPLTSGNLDAAEQLILRAIALDPQEGSYYQTLLFLVINDAPAGQQAKFEQISGLFDKKCANKCTTDERRILARLRFGEKNFRETEKQLRLALVGDPASFPIRTGLAVTLFKMNRVKEGMAELRAAEPFVDKAEDVDKAHYYSLAAVLSMLEGDGETAAQRIRKSLELNPDDPVANALLVKLRARSASAECRSRTDRAC